METEPLQKKEEENEYEGEEKMGCSTAGVITFVLGLIAGTFSALLCKMAYDTSSEGLDGVLKAFSKPIMMLTLMFLGMVPAIFFWWIQQSCLPESQRDVVTYKTMGVLIIPSICDLLCTLLLLVAQLYITASLWQMMRGSIIIITALLKRYALNHRLKLHMWFGVAVITLAMLLVASTSFFAPKDDSGSSSTGSKDPRVGILLVLLGCLAQGVQYVFEEKVMSVDNAPPLVVIGCEGIWGAVLSIAVVYPLAYAIPGADNGSFEDPFDSMAMIRNSRQLSLLALAFVVTVTMYNCAAVYVTKYLSAIWHAILDNFRPITVWGMDLALFYVLLPQSGFGESWVFPASWVQFIGLLLLLFGTAVYNGSVVTFSDMQYAQLSADEKEDLAKSASADGLGGLIRTPSYMASPSITRSPLVYQLPQQGSPGKGGQRSTSIDSSGNARINNRSYQTSSGTNTTAVVGHMGSNFNDADITMGRSRYSEV
mmetsp:Transcript_1402/g.2285  ORF Transcript_1402/g.2285 Transcript_1402/m.2285 type:complete len:482 (-) Transcript_1402:241-1686(-)|eukprot:CAMPEP_0174978216 /NCGR_PEP_ID=MMETSP0004_2-20121128/14064_1 /TAXON_ID=420556 /ORGANISM="Ochromonas sp., Strain CCMP1393" /LENGTH=481 /DNA_ID=CAMNT_0016229531 /DNA_START=74 /DNA_END=1519 /DNA_ORIENTATION=+